MDSSVFISRLDYKGISLTGLVVGLIAILNFLIKLYKARKRFIHLRKQGLSMPKHHPILGHLALAQRLISKMPTDAHSQYLPNQIRRTMPDVGPLFYLDTWPFGPAVLFVLSPQALFQMTQEHSLPKFPGIRKFLRPLTGDFDLVSMEGPMWKTWRNIFNPGFSSHQLTSLVPDIVEETSIFREILLDHVRKADIFPLEDLTLNVTLDVIGRVTMNARFDSQNTDNELKISFRKLIPWLSYGIEVNPLELINPIRPLIHWYYTRRMDRYLSLKLENLFADYQRNGIRCPKSIIDLALNAHIAKTSTDKRQLLDDKFKAFVIAQIKLFIFAGHDTTSSTICYVIYLLFKNPSKLAQIRSEHATVLGSDISRTASVITQKPHLLNQLPYTLAVIKETLRLFPPASSTRAGEPGFFIVDSNGRKYPTENCMVWSNHQAIGRDISNWRDPDAFLPERFLVSPGHPLYPIKGAWRPFEFGPRNCLGQELALLEIKIAMAMTLQEFDFKIVYEELDELASRPPKMVSGERAYQVKLGASHPVDGLPCRVRMGVP